MFTVNTLFVILHNNGYTVLFKFNVSHVIFIKYFHEVMKSKIETDSVSTFLGKLIDKHTTHICGQLVYINNHLIIILEALPPRLVKIEH